jgi:hypothetical protein
MRGSWTAAYPDGRSTVDALLNGEHIVAKGNLNYSLLNDPSINKKLDRLNALPRRPRADIAYGNLDLEIMVNHVPQIPTYNVAFFNLHGSKAHVFASPLHAQFNLVDAWVG